MTMCSFCALSKEEARKTAAAAGCSPKRYVWGGLGPPSPFHLEASGGEIWPGSLGGSQPSGSLAFWLVSF